MMRYEKQAGLVVTVPKLMVKLAPTERDAIRDNVGSVAVEVLHVTLKAEPRLASLITMMVLFAVTLVVLTTQVPVEAVVAQEKNPAGAEEHATSEGFAALPTAAQVVAVA